MIYIKVKGYIYKITNHINGKIYIGKTTKYERRLNEYKNRTLNQSKKYNTPIMRAIDKYGFENFTMEIIKLCYFKEDLERMEAEAIIKYNSADPIIGYNSRSEKDNTLNEITRRKMSDSHKGLTEEPSTKNKKSKKMVAIKGNKAYICDSGKLFADMIGRGKDNVSHAINRRIKINDWYVFRLPLESIDRYDSLKDKNYLKYAKIVIEGVETIENNFDTMYLRYE